VKEIQLESSPVLEN